MAKVFQDILSDAQKAGFAIDRSRESIDWLRDRARNVKKSEVTDRKMMGTGAVLTNKILPGRMYMFKYDAKGKDTLPYWDAFPLVFPFRMVQGGFYGLNLHYLPHQHRALLMDALDDIKVTGASASAESTRLKLSYDILNAASKYRYFKPCVKHYLHNHVRSRFIFISPTEWNMALMLPTERFQGASKQHVWTESRGQF